MIVFIMVSLFFLQLQPRIVSSHFHIRTFVVLSLLANSLVNPLISSMQMRGFRARVLSFFGKSLNRIDNIPRSLNPC